MAGDGEWCYQGSESQEVALAQHQKIDSKGVSNPASGSYNVKNTMTLKPHVGFL
jgi:hypothetical protein